MRDRRKENVRINDLTAIEYGNPNNKLQRTVDSEPARGCLSCRQTTKYGSLLD